jgi:hypothetical protein
MSVRIADKVLAIALLILNSQTRCLHTRGLVNIFLIIILCPQRLPYLYLQEGHILQESYTKASRVSRELHRCLIEALAFAEQLLMAFEILRGFVLAQSKVAGDRRRKGSRAEVDRDASGFVGRHDERRTG